MLIDEADSVLVDEARVPLILAGPADHPDADRDMARVVAGLRRGQHYETDDDARNVYLTSAGTRLAERALGDIDLYSGEHSDKLTQLNIALHAQALLHRDVDYIVRDGRVQLINAARGRVARLQRWPDGLHAAVEAKEGLAASESGEILDSITVQSLVGRYQDVCGMTGTAVAVGEQLREFYRLEIAVIPPNRPCVRSDEPDRLYATVRAKEKAIVELVATTHAAGRPILIGTLDVAESERLAAALGRAGVPGTVLNAKNDAQEAAIVAEAGAFGAVTVSTQMAGRGTDIRLGGTRGDRDQIAALGGLLVIGTGRHASSRLDRQLRGRSGRQGDPGGSVFFASLEDELVLQYAPGTALAEAAGPGPLRDAGAHQTLGHAQRVAEGVNLEIHRNTWRYSKLVDDQRAIVLAHRDRLLRTDARSRRWAASVPSAWTELTPVVPRRHPRRGRPPDRPDPSRPGLGRPPGLPGRSARGHPPARAGRARRGPARRVPQGGDPRLHEPVRRRGGASPWRRSGPCRLLPRALTCAAAGLKRPTATWTYLVHDNPFGTDIDRAIASVGRWLRRKAGPGRARQFRR